MDAVTVPRRGTFVAVLGVCVALVVAVGVASGAVGGSPRAVASGSRVIRWQPCAGNPAVECGGLVLPVDWAHPDGPRFTLALARRAATDPARRIGSLIVDPGGPGGSGVAMVARKDPFPADLHARFDVVGFDPRGSGASDPISCDPAMLAATPTADPATPAGLATLVRYNRELAADCRRRSGPMFDHVDDLSVVRDIDAVRAALGDRALTFYGVSYGTLMGQQYAELFPDRVRALALDSNEDHSLPGSAVGIGAAASAEDSFTQFTQWCATTTNCVRHGRDIGTLVDHLYDRALTGRLATPGQPDQRLSSAALIGLIEDDLLSPDWPDLATTLAAVADAPPAPAEPLPGTPFPEKVDVDAMATICADWSVNLTTARQVATLVARMTAVAPHLHVNTRAWQSPLACLGRPGFVTNPSHPYHIQRGVPPILMVDSRHDPATPYAGAVDVARQVPQATLVTYDGWGHGVYRQSGCVRRIVEDYLITLRTPPHGVHCPAVPPGTTP